MSVAKILEIAARSEKSFEDTIRHGIARADETVKHVQGAWIERQKVVVQDGEIKGFEVIMKVTFIPES